MQPVRGVSAIVVGQTEKTVEEICKGPRPVQPNSTIWATLPRERRKEINTSIALWDSSCAERERAPAASRDEHACGEPPAPEAPWQKMRADDLAAFVKQVTRWVGCVTEFICKDPRPVQPDSATWSTLSPKEQKAIMASIDLHDELCETKETTQESVDEESPIYDLPNTI